MKKYTLFIVLALLIVGCTKEEPQKPKEKEEDLTSISYQNFDFKKLYDLVKNPISTDLLRRRLEAQHIEHFPLGKYEKDFYFIVPDNQSPFKFYRVEVEAGQVLTNFDNPTKEDVKEDYVQNINIYPLNEERKIISDGEQTEEQYKGFFDLVKNSLEEVDSDYSLEFRTISIFGASTKNYDDFIYDLAFDDGMGLWSKTFDEEVTLENSSNKKNVPVIEMQYNASWSSIFSLPYKSKYRILIKANLPKDLVKIIY